MGILYILERDLAVLQNPAQRRRKPHSAVLIFFFIFEFLRSCIDLLIKMRCVALLLCLQSGFVSQPDSFI